MNAAAQKIPPLLNQPRKNFGPAFIFIALIAAAGLARFCVDHHISFLTCRFKEWTGLPCVTCGSTRSFAALGHFQIAEAFFFNPLIFLCVVAIILWFAAWAIFPTQILEAIKARVLTLPVWKIVIALAILNWIYLLRFLPR